VSSTEVEETTAPSPPAAAAGSRFTHRLLVVRELGILLALALLVAVTAADNPRFLSAQSIRDLLLGSAILVILAVGQTIVVVTRNVDLSVGSILGLVAFAVGKLFCARTARPRPRPTRTHRSRVD
jgi:rhamnose transport system permease protein